MNSILTAFNQSINQVTIILQKAVGDLPSCLLTGVIWQRQSLTKAPWLVGLLVT